VGSRNSRSWPAALRGYGPLAAMVGAFVLMVALVPSRAPTTAAAVTGPSTVVENELASGGDGIKPCGNRKDQVANDSYAPPCFEWTGGDNGGPTARGVTAESIKVSYRRTAGGADILSTMRRFQPGAVAPTPEDVIRTVEGLVQYFNKNFQFYGRKITLEGFQGKGEPIAELTGAGQQQAEADAVTVATDLEAFADISATTEPYNAALSAKKVVAFGAPYMSDQYFTSRRPYAWSSAPSCSTVSKATSEAQIKTLEGLPARFAGDPALRTRKRKIAVITPDNKEYQNCLAEALTYIKANNGELVTLSYPLDLGNLGKAAENLLNRLQTEQITTVACACDPLLPDALVDAATKVNYRPEWVVMGTALIDSDIVASMYDQSQWSHAFGITALGQQNAVKDSPAYKAFKSVRPDQEPVEGVEGIYDQLYLLSIGLQMAGPGLTPENFEKGMFAYPERSGPRGTWKFGPGKYTPQATASAVWWDAEGVSPVTGQKGTYRALPGMYKIGEGPKGEPKFFESAGGGTK
jgi:hypothetical protein